jgi:electron transfer flavoprotein alpha/beta subunit
VPTLIGSLVLAGQQANDSRYRIVPTLIGSLGLAGQQANDSRHNPVPLIANPI